MRSVCLGVAGVLAVKALMALPAAADEGQKRRFMAACLAQEPKQHICECMHATAASTLTKQEVELQIAFLSKDTARQAEIKSDPSFDYTAYSEKGPSGLMKTLACAQSRKP